jgi:hypothetical protein
MTPAAQISTEDQPPSPYHPNAWITGGVDAAVALHPIG